MEGVGNEYVGAPPLMVPVVGFPLVLTPSVGHDPGAPPGTGRLVETDPLTWVLLPEMLMFPFAPTLPFVLVQLPGGLVGVVSVDELKLWVVAPPPSCMAGVPLQPVPAA